MFYKKFPNFNLKITLSDGFVIMVDFLHKDTKTEAVNIDKANIKDIIIDGTNINSDSKFVDVSLLKNIEVQLDSYLINAKFVFKLPLLIDGTIFQKSVWQKIQEVNSGSTISYANIAKRLNTSPRAVGNACGKNKLPVFIPCHRVIASNCSLGGFMQTKNGYNLSIKQWLLDHEKEIN